VAQVEMLALIAVYTEKKNEPLQHVSHKLWCIQSTEDQV
jgi:hypothetical protein